MPFVVRENDRVVGVFGRQQVGFADEFLPDNHPDVLAYYHPVGPEKVAEERDRRLAAGFDYDFGGARGVHRIGTTEADMKGWDEVTKLKDALLQTENFDTEIQISTDTGRIAVKPAEWNQVLLFAAQEFRQPIWQYSLNIQAMKPIPADFRDDKYWRG